MKRTVTVLLSTALLAGWALPAWGHVTAEDPSVTKDSDVEITFSVPVVEGGHDEGMHAMHEGGEEPGAGEHAGQPSQTYNEQVTISVPRQFAVLSCDQTTEWNCTAEQTRGSAHSGQASGGTVTFTRVTKPGTNMDHLSFTVHTPIHKGTYRFPTTQKLSDGDEIEWNGDGVTSKNAAPTVQVVDGE
jgi:hypothetical protein